MASRISTIMTGSALALPLVLVCALLVVKAFFVTYYVIPQNGMYPTLPAGSMLFAAKSPYPGPAQVKRGDIVVFTREEGGQRYNYIWRVIGLPGDRIEASGASLAVNGQQVMREQVREEHGTTIYHERVADAAYDIAISQSPPSVPPDVSGIVPADHFFVMGDNRLDARDSRYFGPIPFGTIIGRKL